MNRLIIIGNGFDLAHNLPTSYTEFIDDYWWNVCGFINYIDGIKAFRKYEDNLISIKAVYVNPSVQPVFSLEDYGDFSNLDVSPYQILSEAIVRMNTDSSMVKVRIWFKNLFFERIVKSLKCNCWVDIENEYYQNLVEISREVDVNTRNNKIKSLNFDFEQVKRKLSEYLSKVENVISGKKALDSVQEILHSNITALSTCAESNIRVSVPYRTNQNRLEPHYTFILNFNYTSTFRQLYDVPGLYTIIDIHGQLNNKKNPIIFGFGDEMDDDYKYLENLQNNDFLENIKSMSYMLTGSYNDLMRFLQAEEYHVYIMGHSCGNSDRLLLHTIFEDPNCVSIQICYHEYLKDGTIENDYKDKVMNISRMFNDKQVMRSRMIDRERCKPLVPVLKHG